MRGFPCRARLAELGAQLRGGDGLQALQLPLVRHGPHQRKALAGREQCLDALADLRRHGSTLSERVQSVLPVHCAADARMPLTQTLQQHVLNE